MEILSNTKKRRERAFKWVKEHKVEVSVGLGLLVFSVIGIVVGLKYNNQVKLPFAKTPKIPINEIDKNTCDITSRVSKTINGSSKSSHYRRDHIRNLGNKKASSQKLEEAAILGYQLLKNQTYVKPSYVNAS